MRYLIGFMCVLALTVFGCVEDTCAAGCLDGLWVELEPDLSSSYDVDLLLDGADGAFSCGGSDLSGWRGPTNQTGVGQLVVECGVSAFWIQAAPESLEVSVVAQDGSWTGSLNENPEYERRPRCPGGSELCPPYAVVTVRDGVTASLVQRGSGAS